MAVSQEQVLAFALYEIRQLLSGHLGSTSSSDLPTRAAAHLAYALHNQAESVLRGSSFDTQKAIEAIGNVDRMMATDFQTRLASAAGSAA
jgi:hypothetical protein